MYKPTLKGFFSAIGGMELGLMQAGIKVKQTIDIDKRATACMSSNDHYFSHKIITGDIKESLVLDNQQTDIISGTYPCDRYSTIAEIHNVRTGDELYLHFFRQVAIEQPEAYILENVPGMRKFPVVMEAMTQLPGYYINMLCPVNANNWLPQDRKRLIIVGTKKPFHIPAPRKYKPVRLKDVLERNAQVRVNPSVISRIKGHYRDYPIIVDAKANDIAPCCVAHYHKDMGTRLVKDKNYRYGVRPFTIREYARLQGFPDDFRFPDYNYAYELIGNAVPPPMARYFGRYLVKYFN